MSIAQQAARLLSKCKHLCVLTGAGISAESGIPTFRGPEGYWRVGSVNYHPQEMATNHAFRTMPKEVWGWYWYRRQVCMKAQPNPGHLALVNLERAFREKNRKFHLITQNVDGLHRRAGQSGEIMFEIHGNINFMRDANDVDDKLYPIPEDAQLTDGVMLLPNGKLARPHVLWFDEYYNEELYRYQSALEVARKMDGLLFVGTTLQTNLPSQIVNIAMQRGIPIVECNTDPVGLKESDKFVLAKEKSASFLPELVKELIALL